MAYLSATGYGQNPDAVLFEHLESLAREAAVNAIKSGRASAGLSGYESLPKINSEITEAIKAEFLGGIQDGSLYGISEDEFDAELVDLQNSGMAGWKSAFKKMTKRVKGNVKRARKTLTIKRVKKALFTAKGIKRTVKRVAKNTFKYVKKAAPYVAAGAAIYFGGPLVMSALKGGAVAVGSGVTATGSVIAGGAKAALPAVASFAKKILPGGAAEAVKKAGGSIAADAAKKVATAMVTRRLSRGGVNMQSPESQAALSQYIAAQQAPAMQAAQRAPQYIRAPAPGGDMMKYALPAAIAGGALLLTTLV